MKKILILILLASTASLTAITSAESKRLVNPEFRKKTLNALDPIIESLSKQDGNFAELVTLYKDKITGLDYNHSLIAAQVIEDYTSQHAQEKLAWFHLGKQMERNVWIKKIDALPLSDASDDRQPYPSQQKGQ